MKFLEYVNKNVTVLDGGMGTMLMRYGISTGQTPEGWNITHPEIVTAIHKGYFDAGANLVSTNTFGANPLKMGKDELCEVIFAAVANAKRARSESSSDKEKFIALDIGPLGQLLAPFGSLSFEGAYNAFSEVVKLGCEAGVDAVVVETMTSTLEAKAATLAVKENSDLPLIVSFAFSENGKLLSGAECEAVVAMFEGLGADVIGVNCSLGPKSLFPIVRRMLAVASVPISFKPNAGLPEMTKNGVVYNVLPEEFASDVGAALDAGIMLVGGCCGTTPEYIEKLAKIAESRTPCRVLHEKKAVITSSSRAVCLDKGLTLIGENINPTGKKLMREAVKNHDLDYITDIAISEEERGADVIDVNVGVAGIDEAEFLAEVIGALQYSVSVPLCIDTANTSAMERALRICDGKPMINSVNGKADSMAAVFPLMKKYGGVVIALTLDENGIPDTAEERLDIAKRILATAAEYGIDKSDIIFDPLALTVGADPESAKKALESIRRITRELGCKTSLGVSNISYGLPARPIMNAAFLSMAAAAGLSAAIINPLSEEMRGALLASRALLGYDEGFSAYSAMAVPAAETKALQRETESLAEAIVKGMAARAAVLTRTLLATSDAMQIIDGEIIPALNTVGEGYESGRIFLPGLLLAAEAASSAFEVIKEGRVAATGKGKVVIATVKGDVHDIGKNIVKLLLENYGFTVIDLGRDVPSETILSAVREGCDLLLLSALMTTTAEAMAQTVKLVKQEMPHQKIIVGGAVVTEQYAREIGADAYGKDAMAAVRYAESIINGV